MPVPALSWSILPAFLHRRGIWVNVQAWVPVLLPDLAQCLLQSCICGVKVLRSPARWHGRCVTSLYRAGPEPRALEIRRRSNLALC